MKTGITGRIVAGVLLVALPCIALVEVHTVPAAPVRTHIAAAAGDVATVVGPDNTIWG